MGHYFSMKTAFQISYITTEKNSRKNVSKNYFGIECIGNFFPSKILGNDFAIKL